MHGLTQSPWMTRREAAECLAWMPADVDANLVPLETNPARLNGKMRYQVMALNGDLRVRILAADVFALVPLLPGRVREREAMSARV